MMLELGKAKLFLRVEHDDEDSIISALITAAEEYIVAACGSKVDLECERAQTIALMLVADMYENRSAYGKPQYGRNVQAMLSQLALETEYKGAQ